MVTKQTLLSIKRVIARYGLHDGPVLEPVDPRPLLEDIEQEYEDLPETDVAFTLKWRGKQRKKFLRVVFDSALLEEMYSALLRHATVHEYGHVRDEAGEGKFTQKVMGHDIGHFGEWVIKGLEAECHQISAFVLVRMEALRAMQYEDVQYAAGVIDVPPELIQMRWRIWQKWGM